MGKTSLAIRYINASPHDRVFIFDHQDEFANRLEIGRRRVARDPDELLELAQDHRIVPFDFATNYGGHMDEGFVDFCDSVYELARDGLEPLGLCALFVCDEIQRFVNPHQCPIEFRTIVETGRRSNLDSLLLSQRPNKINGDIREQLTEMFLFRLQDENSLKFAAEVGANTDRVMNLKPLEYLYFNLMNGREKTDAVEFARRKNLPSDVSV